MQWWVQQYLNLIFFAEWYINKNILNISPTIWSSFNEGFFLNSLLRTTPIITEIKHIYLLSKFISAVHVPGVCKQRPWERQRQDLDRGIYLWPLDNKKYIYIFVWELIMTAWMVVFGSEDLKFPEDISFIELTTYIILKVR